MLNKSSKRTTPTDNLTADRSYSPATLPLVAAPHQPSIVPATSQKQQPNTATPVMIKNEPSGMKDKAGFWLAIVLIFFLHVLEKIKLLK